LDILDRMEALVGTRERYWYIKQEMGYFEHVHKHLEKNKFLQVYDKLNIHVHFAILSMIIQHIMEPNSQGDSFEKIKEKLDDVVLFSHKIRLNKDLEENLKRDVNPVEMKLHIKSQLIFFFVLIVQKAYIKKEKRSLC
jgi:hypothetical protein